MSFISVDYDHGCGGEYFSLILSMAPECRSLDYKKIGERTKVFDIFNQEFLKPFPKINSIPTTDKLYNVIPTHRHTELINTLLGKIPNIRIRYPTNYDYHLFVIQNTIDKVLFAKQLGIAEQVGFVKTLINDTNHNFVKKVKHHMLNIDIMLLSKNLEPNDHNRHEYIQSLINLWPRKDPQIKYDLVISYEDLVENPHIVVDLIKQTFNINLSLDLVKKYEKDYSTFRHNGGLRLQYSL